MIIETLAVGPIETNCHIAICPDTKQAAVVDPGGDGDRVLERLRRRGAKVVWVLNTHGHGDHIGGNGELKAAYPEARIGIHPADAPFLLDAELNLSGPFGFPITSPAADVLLNEGDEVSFGTITLNVLHVPGHTPGGIAFFWPGGGREKPVLFSGDALFAGSIGRADFPGGDMSQLVSAIRAKLLNLPPETVVYSGHGGPTTIGAEARSNPFL